MTRKTRSDCTVGAFEKSTACLPEQSETKTAGIHEVTNKSVLLEMKLKEGENKMNNVIKGIIIITTHSVRTHNDTTEIEFISICRSSSSSN